MTCGPNEQLTKVFSENSARWNAWPLEVWLFKERGFMFTKGLANDGCASAYCWLIFESKFGNGKSYLVTVFTDIFLELEVLG